MNLILSLLLSFLIFLKTLLNFSSEFLPLIKEDVVIAPALIRGLEAILSIGINELNFYLVGSVPTFSNNSLMLLSFNAIMSEITFEIDWIEKILL